jgi:predicted dehydrogenase
MNIVIIGAYGHWNIAFQGFSPDRDRIVAVAPGGPHEPMDAVIGACENHGQQPRIYGDFREALDMPGVDIVVSNPRFDRNADVLLAALQRGLPCFAEKPFSIDPESLVALREAWQRSPRLLYPMMSLRAEPAFYAAWQVIRSGRLGTLQLISGQKSYRLGQRPNFFRDREKMGGIIPWVGSHVVDLAYWYTQQPFKRCFASQSTVGNRGYGDLEMSASMHYTMASGIQVTFTLDYLRPPAAASHGDDRIRVAGSDGIVEVVDGRAVLMTESETVTLELPQVTDLFSDCLNSMHGESVFGMGAEDGFIVTDACLMARQSADEGRLISR